MVPQRVHWLTYALSICVHCVIRATAALETPLCINTITVASTVIETAVQTLIVICWGGREGGREGERDFYHGLSWFWSLSFTHAITTYPHRSWLGCHWSSWSNRGNIRSQRSLADSRTLSSMDNCARTAVFPVHTHQCLWEGNVEFGHYYHNTCKISEKG